MKKRKTLTSDYIDLGSGIPVYGYKSKSISEGTDLSLKIQGKKIKTELCPSWIRSKVVWNLTNF